MNANDRAWAVTAALIAVHQAEEVLVSVEDWQKRVGSTTLPWLDLHLRGNWLAASDPRRRVAAQAGQCVGLGLAYLATRRNRRATQVVTTALCAAWSAAFAMHLAVSWRTRTIMPGTSTSVAPGWVGAAYALLVIWRSPRANDCDRSVGR